VRRGGVELAGWRVLVRGVRGKGGGRRWVRWVSLGGSVGGGVGVMRGSIGSVRVSWGHS